MRSGSTSRPLYVPQVGQRRCGRFGWRQFGQTFTRGALIACVARRLSRRDFEVFRFGTAMSAAHYSHNAAVDRDAVLAEFDRLSRREVVSGDPTVRVERDDRSTVFIGEDWSAVLWTDLDESNADAEIARLVGRLREIEGHVEWKLYGHDRPADLRGAARGRGARAGRRGSARRRRGGGRCRPRPTSTSASRRHHELDRRASSR